MEATARVGRGPARFKEDRDNAPNQGCQVWPFHATAAEQNPECSGQFFARL